MTLRTGSRLEVYPLRDLSRMKVGPHVLAHFAYATREFVSRLGVTEYIARNEAITELVTGHVTRGRPTGMVVLSSGAVYLGDEIATNPYGVLKRRDERRFLELAEESGGTGPTLRAVIPRLFNLAGPFLNKPDYVLGSIIRDVARGGPIQLHAAHPVVRSYVHVGDLVELAFAIMLGQKAAPREAFDTAGDGEIEVGELAKLVASVLGESEMEIQRPALDGTPVDRYVGDPAAIRSLALSYGIEMKALSTQIEDTAQFLMQ
jgi:nucleoside-diphosphate-sugar epimerase